LSLPASLSAAPRDELEFRHNLLTIQHHLTITRGFGVSDEDLRGRYGTWPRFATNLGTLPNAIVWRGLK